MFARFFIDRPIFAAVLSILLALGGVVGLLNLPVALYPDVTPPTIEVSTTFPGAHAVTLADTVAAPIEEQVNGVENMLYMTSTCGNDGSYALTVTFKPGTDLNIAQVLVQNRVNVAAPKLPAEVKRRGVTVKKKSTGALMIINLYSPDDTNADLYLSNYATIQLRDELARLDGVGDIQFLGQRDYSMRVWLSPTKLAARGLTPADVAHAIEQQNAQVAAGQIGQPPVPTGQVFQYTINTLGRLAEPEQFDAIVLKSDELGGTVRMKDVTDKASELGAAAYDQVCTLDGRPSVALSIYPLPGSNAIAVANSVKAKVKELKAKFPAGVDYQIVYDTTPFIDEAVNEVFHTLRDAVILVAIVMLVFLQSWRSAIIPLAAVPVALLGTFGFMAAFGFSLNALTLFGLVLAVGIVVDDAIVVVEAVEYHLGRGLSPKAATAAAMDQVAGPVIAVGLVLAAVFVPCLFITGIVGEFFRQFAVTISISTLLSAFNSLTLSPALCALLLKPHEGHGRRDPLPRIGVPILTAVAAYFLLTPVVKPLVDGWVDQLPANVLNPIEPVRTWIPAAAAILASFAVGAALARPINWALGWAFWAFNWLFGLVTEGYVGVVRGFLWLTPLVLVIYLGLVGGTWQVFTTTPAGFIPPQDKGYLLVNLQLQDSVSLTKSEEAAKAVDQLARKIPGVRHTVAVAGQSAVLGGNAANVATVYVMLDRFEERRHPDRSADAIAERLRIDCEENLTFATATVFPAPPIDGLGAAGGFRLMIQDRDGTAAGTTLQAVAADVVADTTETGRLEGAFAGFRADTPWIELVFDREAAESAGVAVADVTDALQTQFGSKYVNDFNRFGRTWQVTVQASPKFRNDLRDLLRLQVPNRRTGQMVPLRGFFRTRDVVGPSLVVRYNLHPVAPVSARPKPGVSSGDAIAQMEAIAANRLTDHAGLKVEWTELALLQLQTGNTALWAFVLAVVLVFLVLAAQYESWALPLAVILVVPMCLLSAVVGIIISGQDVNVFTQIGLVVLVGLASKNAILIVEYARARHLAGASRWDATIDACRLRLRPIIMTSVAFILGVLPLVLAEGAGAEMRRTLGTAVFAGMIGVTLFGVFLTPVFFFAIQWVTDKVRPAKPAEVEIDEPVALVAPAAHA